MDKNRIKGAAKKVEGTLQAAAGKITGNKTEEAAGELKKAEGALQSAYGKAKDAVKRV